MYCLDTTIIIDFLNAKEEIVNKVISLLENNKISVSPITLCEIYKGIFLYGNIKEELNVFSQFLEHIDILLFSKEVSKTFGEEYSRLKKEGIMIPEFDLIIASFVKSNNLTLITKDKHFNRIRGLKVEIW
jgi:predicted nucleic acid-binding protein